VRFTAAEIARVTNGSVRGPDAVADGATQDSRAVEPGQLFVPLVAERDGHDFIPAALDAGATIYLTHRDPAEGTAVVVGDTTVALRALATEARRRISGPVIGITGSVGKTSTKDLLAAALAGKFRTHASERSFNNEIGVPLTLLNTPNDAEATVVEMGSRGIGHIAALCETAAPTIGVITTIASAHTAEFGSLEQIAQAKGELVEALPASGFAVLNRDVDLAAALWSRTEASVITFGTSADADVRVSALTLDDQLRARFTLETPWGSFSVSPTSRGAHQAPNAAAAAAVALWLGVAPDDVAAGFAEAAVSPWRMEVGTTSSGAMIVNDAYNANPASMRGALDSLASLGHQRKIAVLGYMAELGPTEVADHLAISAYAEALGIEVLPVGTDLYGRDPVDDAVATVGRLDADTAVLVKASRSAGLEVVAAQLLGRPS